MSDLRLAFTVGYAEGYDAALAKGTPDEPLRKSGEHDDYRGGWIWASPDEARAFLGSAQFAEAFPGRDPDEFAVYRLELPTGWDDDVSATVDTEDGVHRPLHDALIVSRT